MLLCKPPPLFYTVQDDTQAQRELYASAARRLRTLQALHVAWSMNPLTMVNPNSSSPAVSTTTSRSIVVTTTDVYTSVDDCTLPRAPFHDIFCMPDGSLARTDESSSVIYKMVKINNAPLSILNDFVKPSKKEKKKK
jgi:hypothetical protein